MNLAAEQSASLTRQMKKIARSFALILSYREEPLQQQMLAAYLIYTDYSLSNEGLNYG